MAFLYFHPEHRDFADEQEAQDDRDGIQEPGPCAGGNAALHVQEIGQGAAHHRAGRRGEAQEIQRLALVDIELSQAQGRHHGHEQGQEPKDRRGVHRLDLVQHDGRKDAETHQVRQGIQFLADGGVGVEKPGGEPVAEIEDRRQDHQREGPFEAPLQCEDHSHDA